MIGHTDQRGTEGLHGGEYRRLIRAGDGVERLRRILQGVDRGSQRCLQCGRPGVEIAHIDARDSGTVGALKLLWCERGSFTNAPRIRPSDSEFSETLYAIGARCTRNRDAAAGGQAFRDRFDDSELQLGRTARRDSATTSRAKTRLVERNRQRSIAVRGGQGAGELPVAGVAQHGSGPRVGVRLGGGAGPAGVPAGCRRAEIRG